MRIRSYSFSRLLRIAREVWDSAPSIFLDAPPVDIELFIEREKGIRIQELPGLRRRYGIDGIFAASADLADLAIVVDYELLTDPMKLGRYRFTLAEELGHCILHVELLRGVTSPADYLERLQAPSSGPYDPVERNARLLASFLLMPTPLLLEPVEQILRTFPPAARFLSTAPLVGQLKDPIASQFEVSPEAMRVRLEGCSEVKELVARYQAGKLG